MKFRVLIERKALKQLEKLEKEYSTLIKDKLKELKNGFSSYHDITKLKGFKNHYRLRVGKFRILFESDTLPAMNGGASHEGEGWQNPFNLV